MVERGGDKKYFRILDANLNRAREGLRVVEDTLRFFLDDKAGYESIRKIRHHLDKVTREFYPRFLSYRDSEKDSGRKVKEKSHKNVAAILSANFRRAEESLRVLEEYSRLICPKVTREFKKDRFRLYILEKNVISKN